MLESLKLIDCQSHKETELEFSSGINVIIGENNAGKTAILRALYALALNPKGYYSKLKRWKEHWPIIRAVWNGHEIIRNSKGYILDGRPFKTVGDTVPKDIAKVLNLDPINFKLIREKLFLVEQSPGARARLINRASGLDSQEELIKYCNTQTKNLTDNIKIKAHLRTSLTSTISRLSPVEELENPIRELGIKLERIEKIEDEFEDITEKVERLLELEPILDQASDIEKARSQATEANRLLELAANTAVDMSSIGYSIGELERIEEVLYKDELIKDLRRLARIARKKDTEIKEKDIEWDTIADYVERVGYLMIDIKELAEAIDKAID
jgi:predicted ATP-dependent endonuclease of OLD family